MKNHFILYFILFSFYSLSHAQEDTLFSNRQLNISSSLKDPCAHLKSHHDISKYEKCRSEKILKKLNTIKTPPTKTFSADQLKDNEPDFVVSHEVSRKKINEMTNDIMNNPDIPKDKKEEMLKKLNTTKKSPTKTFSADQLKDNGLSYDQIKRSIGESNIAKDPCTHLKLHHDSSKYQKCMNERAIGSLGAKEKKLAGQDFFVKVESKKFEPLEIFFFCTSSEFPVADDCIKKGNTVVTKSLEEVGCKVSVEERCEVLGKLGELWKCSTKSDNCVTPGSENLSDELKCPDSYNKVALKSENGSVCVMQEQVEYQKSSSSTKVIGQ